MIARRNFLAGLIAAPLVVHVDSLMKIRGIIQPSKFIEIFSNTGESYGWTSYKPGWNKFSPFPAERVGQYINQARTYGAGLISDTTPVKIWPEIPVQSSITPLVRIVIEKETAPGVYINELFT